MLCYRHNGQRKMKNNKLELKDLKIEFPNEENLRNIEGLHKIKVELKTGEIIKDSTVIRHDPLLVEIAKELEIANGENPNELYIERVKFPYWINNDSDYTEIITNYDELRTSLDWN